MAGTHLWQRAGAAAVLILTGVVAGGGAAVVRATFQPLAAGHGSTAHGKPVLVMSKSFALTPLERRRIATSHAVARQVVQVDNSGVGLGSGVIATANGYIVTNNHVVQGGRSFLVTLWNGRRYAARLVGTSATDDLAVLKINARGLSAARFGNSARLRVGQEVLAVGNPLGLGETVTSGVISALRRTQSEGQGSAAYLPNAIQTSAPINPGNSGGALVSLDGQVVGIPTLVAGSTTGGAAQGIGFAIPSSRVLAVVPQLITTGRVAHTGRAYLGVGAQDASQGPANSVAGQPTASGVLVLQVTANGPAARAGMRPGDVIVGLAGKPVPNLDAMFSLLADLRVGQQVAVVVERTDAATNVLTRLTRRVTLGELPANPS